MNGERTAHNLHTTLIAVIENVAVHYLGNLSPNWYSRNPPNRVRNPNRFLPPELEFNYPILQFSGFPFDYSTTSTKRQIP